MTTRAALVAVMAGLVSAGPVLPAAAQQPRPQQPPVFRTTAELIEIDVVVVDKASQPVHGLTKDDFILKDRKKPQVVETFTEVQREIERATELPPLPPEARMDVASNTSAKAERTHVWPSHLKSRCQPPRWLSVTRTGCSTISGTASSRSI